MAKGVKQLQDELVNSSFLDNLGESPIDYIDLGELPTTKQIIIKSAANFILKVQENLEMLGKVNTGGLADGISSGDLIESNGGYEIVVGYKKGDKGEKYYDYVNKGVRGFHSGTPNSPYSFKNAYANKKMATSLLLWYRKRGIMAKNEDQKKKLSASQRKNKSIKKTVNAADNLKSMAYATAAKIKSRGLKKTGFFDKAVNYSFGKEFIEAVSKSVGQDVRVFIRQTSDELKEVKK